MRPSTALLAMLLLCVSTARAQVNFYVNDCGTGTFAATTVTNYCESNPGTAFTAFGSILVPTTTRVGFVGCTAVLDVQSAAQALPDWWDGLACRPSAFVLTSDTGMGGSCPTLWDAVPAVGNTMNVQPGVGLPNRVRFLLSVVLDAGSAYDLTGDGVTETSVFKWTVLRLGSTGLGACAGCTTGACLVLNEVNLRTLSDTPETYARLTTPIGSNHVEYNTFSGEVCPDAVPVRNRTWGAIKALYR